MANETSETRKPLIPPIGDEEVCATVTRLFDAGYSDRRQWEGSWLEWLAFYHGQQYVVYSPEQNKVVPDKRVPPWRARITENRIRTTMDQVVAIQTGEPVMLACRPSSQDFDDVNRADIGSALLRHFHEVYDFDGLDCILKTWKGIIGHAALEVEWNPSGGKYEAVPTVGEDGSIVPMTDPETGETIYSTKGRIDINFYTPFEIIWDPCSTCPGDAQWVALCSNIDPKEVERRFGVSVKDKGPGERPHGEAQTGGSGKLGWILRRIRAIFGPKAGAKDSWGTQTSGGTDVIKFYTAPDEDNPGGRLVIIVGKEVIYDDVSPTEGEFRWPVVQFHHRTHGKRPYGDGIVQDLIDPQREWNKTKSWIREYRDLMMKGKILSPREANIDADAFTTEHAEVIEYDALPGAGAPTIQYPPEIPNSIFTTLRDLADAFNYISGIYDATRGDAPSGAAGSGKALQFQKEQNTQRLQSIVKADRRCWATVGSLLLFYAGKHWEDGEIIKAVGRYYEPMLVEFRKSDFASKMDVVVENDNALPAERVNRMNMLGQMFQKGGIMEPTTPIEMRRQYLSLARFGDLQGLIENENLDEAKARRQFRQCMIGQPQMAAYFDDHATHRRVLTELMKSIEFEQAHDIVKGLVFELDRQHGTYLLGTMPMDPQGRPLPPGTVPPQQMGEMGRALLSPKPQGSPPATKPVQ